MEAFLAARNEVMLYPDALEALERLSAKYPLAAVSNGNADLERIGLHGYFTAIVNARKVGFAKPDPRIFAAACVALETEPDRVLHVGDDPELDVRGAARFGARSAWINRERRSWPGDSVDTHEFHDLIALCEWLDV
jgi:putative hydrolase of the HAD superfamily